MKNGTIGTIIIGIILVLSAFIYLDRIVDSVLPTDWVRTQIREFRTYESNCYVLQLQNEEVYRKNGLQEYQKENERLLFQRKIEIARTKVYERVEKLKEITGQFFLLGHRLRLFMLFFVTFWLLLTGLGFLIIFPWSRWFVFLSVTVNYLWQIYIFLYDKKVADLYFNSQNEILKILELPPLKTIPFFQDSLFLTFSLETAIFVGIFYYFTSASGKSIFKDAPKSDLEQILSQLKEKAAKAESEENM